VSRSNRLQPLLSLFPSLSSPAIAILPFPSFLPLYFLLLNVLSPSRLSTSFSRLSKVSCVSPPPSLIRFGCPSPGPLAELARTRLEEPPSSPSYFARLYLFNRCVHPRTTTCFVADADIHPVCPAYSSFEHILAQMRSGLLIVLSVCSLLTYRCAFRLDTAVFLALLLVLSLPFPSHDSSIYPSYPKDMMLSLYSISQFYFIYLTAGFGLNMPTLFWISQGDIQLYPYPCISRFISSYFCSEYLKFIRNFHE